MGIFPLMMLRRILPGVDIQFVEMSASTYEVLISEFK